MKMNGKKKLYISLLIFQFLLVFIVFLSLTSLTSFVVAQSDPIDFYNSPTTSILAISAAISVGLSVLGSAWALKTVGTAAISAITEREGSIVIPFLAIAMSEALAVYGLIVGILLVFNIPSAA
jgi:F0F1-type ATP synthase membrane subunit c/vacuolar-type H+-ATPase subunit K